eukprot:TRINITY_DN28517_c0_g1_i1.p1 TRINITY_DN28517_c0_g1~~TRINITY_DN28517_c0_g1_i1.p1  ORF type:complete len:303 (-),score=15.95 TRINITY_DN28517_c0_g1_i1:455-1363(-)
MVRTCAESSAFEPHPRNSPTPSPERRRQQFADFFSDASTGGLQRLSPTPLSSGGGADGDANVNCGQRALAVPEGKPLRDSPTLSLAAENSHVSPNSSAETTASPESAGTATMQVFPQMRSSVSTPPRELWSDSIPLSCGEESDVSTRHARTSKAYAGALSMFNNPVDAAHLECVVEGPGRVAMTVSIRSRIGEVVPINVAEVTFKRDVFKIRVVDVKSTGWVIYTEQLPTKIVRSHTWLRIGRADLRIDASIDGVWSPIGTRVVRCAHAANWPDEGTEKDSECVTVACARVDSCGCNWVRCS